jgi:hypothetical protein
MIHYLVGKSLEGSRQPGRETRTPLCVSVPQYLESGASLAFHSIH